MDPKLLQRLIDSKFRIEFQVSLAMAYTLVIQLYIALMYPENDGPAAQNTKLFVRSLQRGLLQYFPELDSDFLEMEKELEQAIANNPVRFVVVADSDGSDGDGSVAQSQSEMN